MKSFLLLTDTPTRAARLAREIAGLGPSLVVDILDPDQAGIAPPPDVIRAVIGDVSFRSSAPIAGLKRHLDRLRHQPPFICLLHEDTPRARAQALALGAAQVLTAEGAGAQLARAFPAADAPSAEIRAEVAQADAVLTRIFDLCRAGSLAPGVVAAGADLIEGALRRSDLRVWLDIVWRFDDATHQHCLLVAGLAAGFGKQLGLRQDDCRRLTEAALLHDVGKSRIPLAILNKPARLDAGELAVMRRHPVLGHELLLDQSYPEAMLAVVRSHHELLDGSGYPDGLRGAQIPDLVRLVTICDIFAALIEKRPYKVPMGGAEAFAILEAMGDKLDRDFVRAFRPIAESVESADAGPDEAPGRH